MAVTKTEQKVKEKKTEAQRPAVGVFKWVTNSIWATLAFAGLIHIMLYFLFRAEGVMQIQNVYMYLIGFILIFLFVVQGTEWRKLKTVLGFKSTYPGVNLILGVMGVGLGITIVSWVTKPASMMFAGNVGLVKAIQPLYIPFSTAKQSIPFGGTVMDLILSLIIVAIFEEFFRILIFKNSTNWFATKGAKRNIALGLGWITSLGLWYSFHYFAYGGLGIGSFISLAGIGSLFWFTYVFPDILGLTGKLGVEGVDLRSLVITGSIGAHWAYDFFISADPATTGISLSTLKLVGPMLVGLSFLSLYLIRGYFTGSYFGIEKRPRPNVEVDESQVRKTVKSMIKTGKKTKESEARDLLILLLVILILGILGILQLVYGVFW